MSEACQKMISSDKAIRYIIGKTMYPVKIWCDNLSALECENRMSINHGDLVLYIPQFYFFKEILVYFYLIAHRSQFYFFSGF